MKNHLQCGTRYYNQINSVKPFFCIISNKFIEEMKYIPIFYAVVYIVSSHNIRPHNQRIKCELTIVSIVFYTSERIQQNNNQLFSLFPHAYCSRGLIKASLLFDTACLDLVIGYVATVQLNNMLVVRLVHETGSHQKARRVVQ